MRPITHHRSPALGPLALTLALMSGVAFGQGRSLSGIRDDAHLFDPKAVESARTRLERIEQDRRIPTVIETIETLGRHALGEMAEIEQERLNPRGLFVLVPRKERKIEVMVPRELKADVTEPQRRAIQDAFIRGFHEGDFNAGLQSGVQEIERVLAAAPGPGGVPTFTRTDREGVTGATQSRLIAREQVRLTLAGARAIIRGAEARAEQLNLKENIAVVDDGGHLLAFERMDGARPASVATALTKAVSAATMRQATGPVSPGTSAPDPLLNLSLQNAASVSGGKITSLSGGLPVLVDGQVIGAVGVGGGTGEQDATVAEAGLAAFRTELASPSSEAQEEKSAPNTPDPESQDAPGSRAD